ncbi:MAG: ABC transporter ATP-binding protein [Bacteroidota bacterium]
MLKLVKVKKKYNSRTVLEVPLLELSSGIYWLKGPNGSGKTTLLKMTAGLIPFEGDILFNDISTKHSPLLYRQQVSWADAEPLFPAFITGIELISLYCGIRKQPVQTAEKLIELFKMNDYVNTATGTYSAGMTKKLSLLLAFLGDAPLVILDEPLITLDPEAFTTVCSYILERHQHTGTSFLMSSHDELDDRLQLSGKEVVVQNQTVVY